MCRDHDRLEPHHHMEVDPELWMQSAAIILNIYPAACELCIDHFAHTVMMNILDDLEDELVNAPLLEEDPEDE